MISRRAFVLSSAAGAALAAVPLVTRHRRPDLLSLIDGWEAFPTYQEWTETYGHGRWRDYDRRVQQAYRRCREAFIGHRADPRLRYALASLIDKGGGDDEVLLSGEILEHCRFAIRARPNYHEAHALLASHASFLSVAAAGCEAEAANYGRWATVHAFIACDLQPERNDYQALLREVRETAWRVGSG